jgi:membrane-associated HD superfamily phosphohydrolase
LIAPFNFAILKTEAEIKAENDSILNQYNPYFTLDTLVKTTKVKEFELALSKFADTLSLPEKTLNVHDFPRILAQIYQTGVLQQSTDSYDKLEGKKEIMVIKGNTAVKTPVKGLYSIKTAYKELSDTIRAMSGTLYPDLMKAIDLSDFVVENLYFDEELNRHEKKQLLDKLSTSKGMVQGGERIIFQGDLVGTEKYMILESLKQAYEKKRGDNMEYFLVIAGRLLIISFCIALMFLYLLFYRRDIFDHKRRPRYSSP